MNTGFANRPFGNAIIPSQIDLFVCDEFIKRGLLYFEKISLSAHLIFSKKQRRT